jgi:hypothetical protein
VVTRLQKRSAASPSLDVGSQFGADVGECDIDVGGEYAHTGDGGESDERDDESVFDEVLTFFVLENVREHLSFGVNLQDRIFHGGVFSDYFFDYFVSAVTRLRSAIYAPTRIESQAVDYKERLFQILYSFVYKPPLNARLP